MAQGFILRAADILLKPAAFFRQVQDGTLMEAALFFLTALCIHSILAGVVIRGGVGGFFCSVPFISTTPTGADSIIAAIAGSFLFGIISVTATGAGIHLTAVACGAKNGVTETFRALLYGVTPLLLIGWIPLAGIFTTFWSMAVTTYGIRELQNLSLFRAAVTVFIPAAILIGVCSFGIAPLFFGYDYTRFFSLPCR
ncbi:YIP1 family protein [Methanogenium sp. S4BF]|uniref:YIP1 family protein n=1 Tax=Methanogenium sp. S4BF TaxID=1789226 RepID=UPI0024166334|nr:YIP1 family protein [Methanogenium sp. S4BF]WFN34094.1 YIP1 family protein [Methanogenium sp. S4BF]